jgi:nucleotide-binding universal stress UspA family protein
MSIKDILVALAARGEEYAAVDFALSMAAAFDAHITGIAYALEPTVPFSISPEFTSGLLQQYRDEAHKQADLARSRFIEAASRAGVRVEALAESKTLQQATGDFALRLRTADLAVLAQHQSGDLERVGDLFAEAALFQSGRPMIIVPRKYAGNFSSDRILVAWDGSMHVARAVAAAMPILSKASDIGVLTIREPNKGYSLRANELVSHLQFHNLNATVIEREDKDIPEAILREVRSFQASLVVMGGYGHSRLREFIFGGVTRLMLSKLPVPVLMAH